MDIAERVHGVNAMLSITLTICITVASAWMSIFPPIGHDPESCRVATEKEAFVNHYHGINFASWENGKGTFKRDGVTCRLYTKAFEKKWGKR